MSYYRAKGDPSWLTGLWGAVKPILGAAAGAWLGAELGMAPPGQVMGPPGPKPTFPVGYPGATPGIVGGNVTFPGGTNLGLGFMTPGQGRLPPFTATGPGVLPGGGRGGALVPSGYHFAKNGSGKLVRNRRMNVANPRALRRSMRRVAGFEKLAKRTIQFTRRVKLKKKVC